MVVVHRRNQAWEAAAEEAEDHPRSQAWAEGAAEGHHRSQAWAVVAEAVHH